MLGVENKVGWTRVFVTLHLSLKWKLLSLLCKGKVKWVLQTS